MLGLRIQYLSGRVYAANTTDPSVPEFPPHPFRLFSALVDALHGPSEEHDAAEREALLWLEKQGAPSMKLPEFIPADPAPLTHQPVNDDDGLQALPHRRTRKDRYFPAQALGVPHEAEACTVWYIWAADPGQNLVALKSLTARVASLGHSMSLVALHITDQPPAPDYGPAEAGEFAVRTPGPGLLERLETNHARYQETGRRVQLLSPRWQSYAPIGEPSGNPPCSDMGNVVAVVRLAGRPLAARHALALAEAARNAVLSHWPEPSIPAVISGHEPDGSPYRQPHLAVCPLLDAAHVHADGHLGGVGFVVPDAEIGHTLLRALTTVSTLRLGELGALPCHLVPPWAQAELPRFLSPWTYSATATNWGTVTPALLHRHPRSSRPVEGIVAQLCTQVGLPEPIEIHASHVPPHAGAPLAGTVYGDRFRGRPRLHLRLCFNEPVRGPLLLGVGRYFGMGLMRPTRSNAQERVA